MNRPTQDFPAPFSAGMRRLFPVFQHYPDLVYLDSAATSQKPGVVIDAIRDAYLLNCANPGRGVYPLAEAASAAVQQARTATANALQVPPGEIVFTAGTSSALNMAAFWMGGLTELRGRRIVVTALEHNSNYLPWQRLAERFQAEFAVVPAGRDGAPDRSAAEQLAADGKTAVFCCTAMSNVTGIQPDVAGLCALYRECGALTVVDAAQYAAHQIPRPGSWGCDLMAFSTHKCYGPGGIGILWAREEIVAGAEPLFVGGGMVAEPLSRPPVWLEPPSRHECGTLDVASIGAVTEMWRFLESCQDRNRREAELTALFCRELLQIPGVRLLQGSGQRGIISFTLEGIHPHDCAHWLGVHSGVAVRAGQLCAAPWFASSGLAGVVRLSLGIYNTAEDIPPLVQGVSDLKKILL